MIDWRALPGNDWRYIKLVEGERGRADRMTALALALVMAPPDFKSKGGFGLGFGDGTEKAFRDFLRWLTPGRGQSPSDFDGYQRRQALGIACEQLAGDGARAPGLALAAAKLIYQTIEDDGLTPAAGPRRRVGATA